MHDFAIIFRVQMKERLRTGLSKQLGNNLSRGKTIGMSVLLIFVMLMLAAFWSAAIYGVMYALRSAGMGLELGLFISFFASMLMTLFFCVASVLGNLFHARDIELLSALPLKSTSVFAAKMAWVYLTELLVSSLFALPAIIIYGILSGAGAAVYVSGIAVLLLLPMIPLAVATFVSLLLARFTLLSRHRDKLMIFFGVAITLFFIIGQQFLSQSLSTLDFTDSVINALINDASGVFAFIARIFPPAQYAAEAASLQSGAAMGWLLYLVSSLAALALTLVVASRVYQTTAMASRETSKRGGKSSKLNISHLQSASPMMAFFRREVRNVTRSVTYAMNSLIGVILFPVMVAIVPFTTATTISASDGMAMDEALAMWRELGFDMPYGLVFAIAFAVCMFLCMSNLVASTSISREGDGLWLCKVLPVPYRTQVYGKLIFAAGTSAATIVLSAAVFCFMMPAVMLPVILAALAAVVASVMPAAVGMMVDLVRPKLKWHSEAEAIKQNLNGVLGMLITILASLALAVPAFLLAIFVGFVPAVAVTFVLTGGLSALSVWLLGSTADKRLDAIQV